MKKQALLSILFVLGCVTYLYADPSSVGPSDQPAGQPIRIEVMVVLALAAFVIFKLFDIGKAKEPPMELPPPPPKPKPMMKQVQEAIGEMHEIGDKTYIGGKLVASKQDVETYLMMAHVDKSHIRRQERAMAQEAYEAYEKKIFYLKITVGLFIVFILAITHDTLIDWFMIAYEYIKGLFSSVSGG